MSKRTWARCANCGKATWYCAKNGCAPVDEMRVGMKFKLRKSDGGTYRIVSIEGDQVVCYNSTFDMNQTYTRRQISMMAKYVLPTAQP